MAYSALGPNGPAIDRIQAAMLGKASQRGGPVMRAARVSAGGRRPPSRREQMEERWARKNEMARLEKAFNALQAREAEKHDLTMTLGREQIGQAPFERDMAMREADQADQRLGIAGSAEDRLYEAMKGQMGMAESQQQFQQGPAFGLQQRQQAERERANLSREGIDRSQVELGKNPIEQRMRALQAMYDAAVQAGDLDRAKSIQETMAMAAIRTLDPSGAPGDSGMNIGGETPQQAYEGIQQSGQDQTLRAVAEQGVENKRELAKFIAAGDARNVATIVRAMLVRGGIEPTKQNILSAVQLLTTNPEMYDAIDEYRVLKRSGPYSYDEASQKPNIYINKIANAIRTSGR